MRGLLLVCLLLLPLTAEATTYYVDFVGGSDANNGTSTATAWQRVKGMVGCTSVCNSTTLAPGDTIIFKGGVTWTDANWPWTISTSGSAGNPITYTVDDTWFTGASWTRPRLAGDGSRPTMIESGGSGSNGASYVTFNNLHLSDCGTANSGTGYTNKCVIWWNAHDLIWTNMRLQTYVWISIWWLFDKTGTYDNFVFSNNECTDTSGCLWWHVGAATPNVVIGNLTANNNLVHDFRPGLMAGVHGDGLLHAIAGESFASSSLHDVEVCNNNFYGDFRGQGGAAMTAFIFFEGGFDNVNLCNNQFTWTPSQASMFDSLIVLEADTGGTGIGIYGNTFYNAGVNASSAGIREVGTTTLTIKNNIFSGIQYPLYMQSASSSFRSDHNQFHNYSNLVWGASFKTFAQWNTTPGQDLNSVNGGTLGIVDGTAPTFDLHLLASASGIGQGANLSGLGIPSLNTDYDGVARGTTPDIGALQFSAGGVPPTPPFFHRRVQP